MNDFKFSMHDKVKITDLNIRGRVIALYLSEGGKQYRVRYFDDAEPRTEYFYEDELVLSSQPTKINKNARFI